VEYVTVGLDVVFLVASVVARMLGADDPDQLWMTGEKKLLALLCCEALSYID